MHSVFSSTLVNNNVTSSLAVSKEFKRTFLRMKPLLSFSVCGSVGLLYVVSSRVLAGVAVSLGERNPVQCII